MTDRLLVELDLSLRTLTAMHRLLAMEAVDSLLEDHCRRLCFHLVQAFGYRNVVSWAWMDGISLSREKGASVAAIIVELVANTLKHGDIPGLGGTIWVDLRRTDSGAELAVGDSRNAPFRIAAPPAIVLALARGLAGHAHSDHRPGYTVIVRFPLDEIPESALRQDGDDGCATSDPGQGSTGDPG